MAPQTLQNEPLVIAWRWRSFTLYGDHAGRRYFLGPRCGLCRRGDWTVRSRNWRRAKD